LRIHVVQCRFAHDRRFASSLRTEGVRNTGGAQSPFALSSCSSAFAFMKLIGGAFLKSNVRTPGSRRLASGLLQANDTGAFEI
jgi:hypothetical protein